MIKYFYLLTLLLTFFALKSLRAENAPSVSLAPVEVKNLPGNDVHPLAFSWNAELYLVNFNQDEEQKIREAVTIIKRVIASKAFRERVLSYEFQGKKGFIDNQGLTNEEIYQRIMEGAEQMGNTARNNIMDVELELYHQSTNTIGYTYPNTTRIWINKKYFSRYSPLKVADNLMHEWMHKLGFTHALNWSKERDHSVPYAIGYLIEELAQIRE